jgi:rod shape-determining protein MreD
MAYYIILPFFTILLIVLQRTLLDLLFGGRIGVEVSLILVIYAGFHLDMVRGGVLAFLTGFLLDCVSGTITGLYTFTYVLIFILSYLLSPRIYGERMLFIMGYAFLCVLLEGLFIFAVYWSVYGTDVSQGLLRTYLPQALVAGVLSPALFALFNRLEDYVHAGEAR